MIMNSKKAKRDKEESLLIAYSGEERNRSSESENNVPPLDLPPTRLRRPRARKLHVAQPSKNCCSVWNALQMIFVLFTVGTMISMLWFTLILKTSLESMRKKITTLESFDRSTSREYESLNDDLTKKYELLQTSKEDSMKQENAQYKSILKQIAYLNSTVNDLQNRMKLPEGAHAITTDIESLEKGMADTGGDITEIKDKIKQLTDLAGQQHGKVDEISNHLYNLSLQVAHLTGRPAPEVPKVTTTPPLILRMPISADEDGKMVEKSSLNMSARISVEVARMMGIVTAVNNTLSSEVDKLRYLMKNLLEEVKKHVVTVDDLQSKVSTLLRPENKSVQVLSRGHLEMDSDRDVEEGIHNLSVVVSKLSLGMDDHTKKLAELMLEVVQINNTVYLHQTNPVVSEKSATCNCSTEVNKLWEALSTNEKSLKSVQKKLRTFQKHMKSPKKNASAVEITQGSIAVEIPTTETPAVDNVQANLTAETPAIDTVPANLTTESEAEKAVEETQLTAEDIKASPSTINNSTSTVVTPPSVKPSVTNSSSEAVNITLPTNSTAKPAVVTTNSTESMPSVSASVSEKDNVTAASITEDEKIEESLEKPGSEE